MSHIDDLNRLLSEDGWLRRVRMPAALEADFHHVDRERRRRMALFGMTLGLFFYSSLLCIDWFLLPDIYRLEVMARLRIGVPFGLIAFWLLSRPSLHSWTYQSVACLFGLIGAITISSSLAQSSNPAALIYFNMNFVVLCFTINLADLTPVAASALCVTITCVSAFFLGRSAFGSLDVVLVYGIIGAILTIVCVFANWCLANEKRRQFLVMQRDRLLLRQLSEQRDMLERLSAIDPLTGLANRRGFDAMMAGNLDDTREGASLAVGVVDIDFFKGFNDTYGHKHGDEALKAVAAILADASRGLARVARVGGEEFALLITNPDEAELTAIGERLCQAVENKGISHAGSLIAPVVTISIGLAGGLIRTKEEFARLFDIADKALYAAKRTGRNRACVAAAA